MKRINIMLYLLLFIGCTGGTSSVQIENLRCEYLNEPLGIDIETPRFSWELTSAESGKKQQAYQLLVSTDKTLLDNDQGDVWNSGKIKDKATNQIIYQGEALQPHIFYYWKLRVWDEKGNVSGWSKISSFSVDTLYVSDWKSKWISEPEPVIPPEKNTIPIGATVQTSTQQQTKRNGY
ncbi:MAG: hypothetical protein LIO97_00280 [Tannerellaceae bacterium]|nr:hypothetical protein [Tannerellaceae bacterium]